MVFDPKSDSRFTGDQYFSWILVGLILALIVCIGILAGVPPVSRDALTHHLAVPKLYLQHGGIYEIPDIVFSYYPMNLDLLYMIPLYFGNDIVPKFIHFAFALMTSWLIFGYVQRRLNRLLALLAVLFFLSLPIVIKLSTTVYVDLGVALFSTAALMTLFRWRETGFKTTWLLVSSISCGLAMGTKYNGLVVCFLLTLFVPFVYVRNGCPGTRNSWKAVGVGLFFMFTALLTFSPWMARNMVWKGNPIYPLYDSVFKALHQTKDVTVGKLEITSDIDEEIPEAISARKAKQSSPGKLNHFAIRHLIFHETGWQIALVPLRIFFEGQDDQPQYFDGRLNPYLLILPLMGVLGIKRSPPQVAFEKKILFSFSVLFLLYAFFQVQMRIRYIIPIVPPLVILGVYGLSDLIRLIRKQCSPRTRAWCNRGLVMVLCISIGANAVYLHQQFIKTDPFSYISGRLSRDDYITRFRPEYPAVQYVNTQTPASARILALFMGNRRYYSDRQMLFGNEKFRHYVTAAADAGKIGESMKRDGITLLIVRHDLFQSWVGKTFDQGKSQIVRDFFMKQLRPLFYERGFGVYELR